MQRWVKFAKYLPAEGWQPVIYTPLNPELIAVDKSLEAEIPREVEVVKRKILEPYAFYRLLVGKKAASEGGSNEVNPVNSQKKTLKQKVSMALRGNLFIPDPRCWWVGPSVRYLKKYLKKHPVDIIISTGPPHSMHLIGQGVARATGLPWIADFRDPWTKMHYFKHLSLSSWAEKKHKRLEKKVLDDATAVISVSPPVRDDFQSMTSTPVALITNGWDEDDFNGAVVEEDGYFNLVHTGLFAADGNPDVLWKVLAQKCEADEGFDNAMRIRLVGKTDTGVIESIREAGLSSHLIDNGYQPHEVAVKEQKAASVLMLPLRKEPEYKDALPGKLFEYLASGKPILGIGQPDGAMAAVLNSAEAGFVADWDDEAAISRYIDLCWEKFKAGESVVETSGVEKYSRRRLTADLVKLMDSLIK